MIAVSACMNGTRGSGIRLPASIVYLVLIHKSLMTIVKSDKLLST